jgi:multiple sugar transport system substrate-binding protein
VTRSIRRKQTVDDAFLEDLFAQTNSLYRLDQRGESVGAPTELGALPQTAVNLLLALGITWVLILAYVGANAIKNWRRKHKTL